MGLKVLVTGATGYIGGDALVEIIKAHPDWEITCTVRNSGKGAKIAAIFPNVRLVYGDLDSVEIIEEEASKADIVYHFANCDHVPSAQAISRGLARRESSTPGFWIHTSGTLILAWKCLQDGSLGESHDKVYNDWDGIAELTSFPSSAPHRPVDEVVLAASEISPDKIKTAIVCPPTIYGRGRGPDNQRSVQLYRSAEAFLRHQQPYMVGGGKNVWHMVHVADLSKLYLLLGEAAAKGGPPATWNDEGYYLAENGNFVWGEAMTALAKEGHKQGVLASVDARQLSAEEADKLMRHTSISTGSDSQGQAIRGRKLLGWSPREKSLFDEIPTIIADEAKALGLVKSHAEKVTGE